jgi:alkylation response protein AidB-like acyl-CoA dehydrogenase
MDLTPLTEEQQAIVDTARAFAAAELAPHVAQWDRDAHFEPGIVAKLGSVGLMGMLMPEKYDGLGLDTLTYLLALEEIAAVDASTAVLLSVHNTFPTQMIHRFGTEAQRAKFLKPLACGAMLGAFAISEPDAGSDAAALSCQAQREGDHWVLNGTKSWVTNGGVAGVIMVMARTDTPDARRGAKGISAFIVTPDRKGFHVGKKENKMGLRGSPTVQLQFEGMRLPADALLGEEGRGFAYSMQSLQHGRLGIAAQAIGIARTAFELSVAYARERKQFGRPIGDFQAIQHKLADMATRIHASRALLHAVARAKDRGEKVAGVSSMAKLLASETAMWVTTQAVQVFGGYGYVTDYPVERLFRDAKVTEIYEGTSEIQRMVFARSLLHAQDAENSNRQHSYS